MTRRWWIGGAAVAVLASGLWAKQGVVRLKDNSPPLTGDVDESKPGSVTVTIHGVQETIPRDRVASIEYSANVDEEFKARLAKLEPRDAAGRVEVARWAFESGRLDLARKAANEALAIDPTNAQAQGLMSTLNHQATLVNRGAAGEAGGAPPAVRGGVDEPAGAGQAEKHYLTPADINEIRQLEMKPTDTNLRVTFDHDVRKKFLSMGVEEQREFFAKRPVDQARDILNKGDPSMAPDVKIESDPASLVEFHQRIQPSVLSGCAASGCHNASTAAGGFGLYTGDESPAAWYTNFYLIQSYTSRGKNGPTRSMVDRTYPEKSLLAQYGLPANAADTPHPPVPNLRQSFTSLNDPHYLQLLHWMGTTLRPDAGTYPDVRYEPTWAGPTSRPSAERPRPNGQ